MKRGVLKGVSRSFYLSLRLLPGAMQEPAGIAYLLARVADTIADSAGVAGEVRRGCLEEFLKQVAGQGLFCGWPGGVVEGIWDGRERHLLGVTGEVLEIGRASCRERVLMPV